MKKIVDNIDFITSVIEFILGIGLFIYSNGQISYYIAGAIVLLIALYCFSEGRVNNLRLRIEELEKANGIVNDYIF